MRHDGTLVLISVTAVDVQNCGNHGDGVKPLFVACLTRPMVTQQVSTHTRSWRLCFRETAAVFTLFPLVLLRARIRSTRAPWRPWSIPSMRANDGASLWQHCTETNAGWTGVFFFLMLSLFVCRSHKTLAFCHYFSFTNCFYFLCILWKCTVCIDVGICFIFFCVELERMNWGANWKKVLVCAFLMEPSSCWCCVSDSGQRCMMMMVFTLQVHRRAVMIKCVRRVFKP